MATPFNLGGLLGTTFGGGLSSLEDLLTPEQRAAIQQQAGLSAAAALLQAAGPSTTPTSLGQALGSAFTAGQAGLQKGTESALTQMLTRQKLEEAKRAQDLQANIAKIMAPVSGPITAEEALAASGMAAGPTVQSAALIGQPRPEAAGTGLSANERLAEQYRRSAQLLSANNQWDAATKASEMAEKLAPSRPEVVGAPIKTKTGYVQYTKTGQFIPVPKDYEPAAKPIGQPEVRTEASTGRQVLVQAYDNDTYQTVPGYGPARKLREIQRGGSVLLVDEDAIPARGLEIPKTLPPQIVGGAETGFFQVGGGRGGIPPLSAAPGAAAPAAPARAPAAVAAPAAAPAAAPGAPAPVTTGLQPIIPGTGKDFANEKDIRAEFTKAAQPFVDLSQAFQKIENAAKNPSGAGDISLIYGYMKILDPGSVVREGEFATAANAGGVPDAVKSMYNKALSGQRLTDNVRSDFLGQARNLIESQRTLSDDLVQRYKDLATQYKLQPDRVVFDPFKRIKKPEEILQQATPPAPRASSPRGFYDRFGLIPRD